MGGPTVAAGGPAAGTGVVAARKVAETPEVTSGVLVGVIGCDWSAKRNPGGVLHFMYVQGVPGYRVNQSREVTITSPAFKLRTIRVVLVSP